MDKAIDEVFSRANPNPERVGCPPRETLVALARRERPIGDAGYAHLAECSECYREFRDVQRTEPKLTEPHVAPARRLWLSLAAAALVVAVIGLAWLIFVRPQPDLVPAPQPEALRADIDLRPFTTSRSDEVIANEAAVTLPIGLVHGWVVLPTGSEPGTYEIALFDSALTSHSSGSGVAEIRDYVTTLDAVLDLREVRAGNYQLGIRRDGDNWRLFPARVR